MYDITIYPEDNTLSIIPGKRKREWMDNHVHAYKCTPLAIANEFGWDIILPYDIKVEWDGTNKLEGLKVLYPNNGNVKSHFGAGTITFHPGFRTVTEEYIYLMICPIPNQFSEDFLSLSAIIETDKLKYPWFLSIKMLHKGITVIPKNTKLARIIPINVKASIPTRFKVETEIPESFSKLETEFAEKRRESQAQGIKWTKDYVNSVDFSKVKMS